MIKFRTYFAALMLCAFAAPAAVGADASVAFVNSGRVLEQAPQAKAARERLQQEFAPRDSEIQTAQKTLKGLQEKLERDGAVMSAAERGKLEHEIVAQQRELKRSQSEFSEDLNLRRNEEFAKLQRETADAIVAIAKENGYDLVFEAGVVYASEKVDITDRVIGRLREQFNKAPAPKAKK